MNHCGNSNNKNNTITNDDSTIWQQWQTCNIKNNNDRNISNQNGKYKQNNLYLAAATTAQQRQQFSGMSCHTSIARSE